MTQFNFTDIAILFAAISLAMIGVSMAGSIFWPEQTERYKRLINSVILGVVLVALSSAIVAALH
jgi:hypothetical protein